MHETLPSEAARTAHELVLTDEEREALLRVFYVVKDNFWLDKAEESILERLREAA